jgi:hypothetical protein
MLRPNEVLVLAGQEAALPFEFPQTFTSVSYMLRQAYCTFLWDYEQVP